MSAGRIRRNGAPAPVVRSGVVLIVMIGVSVILGAMVMALVQRAVRSDQESRSAVRFAQAYLMTQAARVYLCGRWLDTSPAMQANLSSQRTSATVVYVHRHGVSARAYGYDGYLTWNDYRAVRTTTEASRQNSGAGWFAFRYDPATQRFWVLGVGGGSRRKIFYDIDSDNDGVPDIGQGDVRIYGIYDPLTDTFSQQAPYPPAGFPTGAPWDLP
jgi:type II secretory pathway pseudopilin PulG